MDRRRFMTVATGLLPGALMILAGCRGKQYAHVLKEDENNMVGSHKAGSEVYEQQVTQSVAKLLGRECNAIQQVSHQGLGPVKKKICFVGVENASSEDLGDFKQHLCELIDQEIGKSEVFQQLSQRYVEAGLRDARLRPDELFRPSNQKTFQQVMERNDQPFDYLLFAKLTSGSTVSNGDYQRDYMLTLELVDIHSGETVSRVSEKVRKGYHKSFLGRLRNYGA